MHAPPDIGDFHVHSLAFEYLFSCFREVGLIFLKCTKPLLGLIYPQTRLLCFGNCLIPIHYRTNPK